MSNDLYKELIKERVVILLPLFAVKINPTFHLGKVNMYVNIML